MIGHVFEKLQNQNNWLLTYLESNRLFNIMKVLLTIQLFVASYLLSFFSIYTQFSTVTIKLVYIKYFLSIKSIIFIDNRLVFW